MSQANKPKQNISPKKSDNEFLDILARSAKNLKKEAVDESLVEGANVLARSAKNLKKVIKDLFETIDKLPEKSQLELAKSKDPYIRKGLARRTKHPKVLSRLAQNTSSDKIDSTAALDACLEIIENKKTLPNDIVTVMKKIYEATKNLNWQEIDKKFSDDMQKRLRENVRKKLPDSEEKRKFINKLTESIRKRVVDGRIRFPIGVEG